MIILFFNDWKLWSEIYINYLEDMKKLSIIFWLI